MHFNLSNSDFSNIPAIQYGYYSTVGNNQSLDPGKSLIIAITFPRAFKTKSIVCASIGNTSDNIAPYAQVALRVQNSSETGFEIVLKNNSTIGLTPGINWIAVAGSFI